MAKVIKKAQGGFAANLLKKKATSDTTRMYDREEFINNINKGLKTSNAKSSSSKGIKSYKYISQSGDTTAMNKENFEKRFTKAKAKAKDGKWIQKAIKKPGALRAQLGAKPGKPIPAAKLAKAAKAKGKLGQRARLAMTLKKMKK